MSDKKKLLQTRLNQNNNSEDRSLVRTQMNRLQNDIHKRIKFLQEERANILAKEINETDSSRACFAATRQLARIKRAHTVSVHDKNSNFIGTDAGKAATLRAISKTNSQRTRKWSPLIRFLATPVLLQYQLLL